VNQVVIILTVEEAKQLHGALEYADDLITDPELSELNKIIEKVSNVIYKDLDAKGIRL
jgi:hypothetical protein